MKELKVSLIGVLLLGIGTGVLSQGGLIGLVLIVIGAFIATIGRLW